MVNSVDVVIGAGGGCGTLCVEHLLGKGGKVRAVGRVGGAQRSCLACTVTSRG